MSKKILKADDGFNPRFVEGADFDGLFDFPVIKPYNLSNPFPSILVPFSQRNKVKNKKEAFVCCYEYDTHFAELTQNPDAFIKDLKRFGGVISPDNSVYRDMPFACIIGNIYRSRMVGYYLQKNGIPVITNIRWGADNTLYEPMWNGRPVALNGAPKENVVAIGTYGCIKGRNNKIYFKKGLEVMINILKPKYVIVYGAMPEEIFGDFMYKTSFIRYDDWTTLKHRRGSLWEQG